MAQITPPGGFNLFMVQGLTGLDIGRAHVSQTAHHLHCSDPQRLAWVRSGHNASDAPLLEIGNAHGLFTIRGCSLHAAAAGEPEAVGIQITLHVHRALRLLQALRLLSLAPRQSEIGFWLARGLSEPDIAQRMKLSLHTVVYHRRQLHDRLGTRNRKELLARLLGARADAQS